VGQGGLLAKNANPCWKVLVGLLQHLM